MTNVKTFNAQLTADSFW